MCRHASSVVELAMLVVAPQQHMVAEHMQCAGCQHLLLCVLSRALSTGSYFQVMHLRAGDLPDTVECIHHKVRNRQNLCPAREFCCKQASPCQS